MAVSKLIIFLAISMAFVLTVRCQDEFEYVDAEIEKVSDANGQVPVNATEPGKKGFANCVKEKVKKVVDKGKQVLKAAGDAISNGYNNFKAKAKEIIGKKQPETFGSSTPSDLSPPSQFIPSSSPSESYPPPSVPSVPQSSAPTQSQTDDRAFELIDPRQKFTK